MAYESIVQLNKYPAEQYNVLVPVTTMQVASNLQKITVSEVKLDTRQNPENKGPSKDIYFEKSSGNYAITKVGGMKLAAAANISIVSTTQGRTEVCQRCIEMARATGKAKACGDCAHAYDVAVTVTIRVPEPTGGFRIMQATKEIDSELERRSMTDKQFTRFLPHRTAIAESKAFMRAIRAALGLAGTYDMRDLQKPFIVARIVPNLDAPEIKQAVASNYLQSMGMLFETPTAPKLAAQIPENVPAYEDEAPGSFEPGYDSSAEYDEYGYGEPDYEPEAPPAEEPREQPRSRRNSENYSNGEFCRDCGREITDKVADYSRRNYGRCICMDCQKLIERRPRR